MRPDRPETWLTRPRFLRAARAPSRWVRARRLPVNKGGRPPAPVVDSFPLARRLESVRRVLARPDAHVRRVAIRLARIAQRNAAANEPVTIGVAEWPPDPARFSRGAAWIATGMARVQPVLVSQLDRWNEAAEPG